ncbi:bacillithiol biosynthesis cysteine-adding enzyme BshC [Niastella yeongjuensis]|uniref:Putative cysteine ligase BshC n=1 Tax=Niastella yeongjuensis TaxID=354355 RepID=A0A1V9EEZ5_9BACT|nr:bacillithiol biosynthesis cysteine-adding enzyme BshC [Niastella yeongjuensis]OQP44717.1 bacillithiol biosynthesis cysteine-adding enzyme BshC [Niastella yeongjuensis]SEO77802.1 bacillithiol biosynthesis cysteine-adding enzyme BshC [Niastella yeongjuensis]
MDCTSTNLSVGQTGYFSRIILDYLNQSPSLQPFYKHPVSMEGIKAAIQARQSVQPDRNLLVKELQQQYAGVNTSTRVQQNIQQLLQPNTFTITTAHQPAIFTGHLYFIYKIVHVIKLADRLKKEFPDKHFVPVFWMGSEDADLDELGHVYLGDEKLVWDTKQTGAVGRMTTKGLDKLIHRIDGELSVQPHGKELIQLLREAYLESPDIQIATFKLIDALFADYGLIVILPDNANLKKVMEPVFREDLLQQKPAGIVGNTIKQLSLEHKVQASPRDINLFYLKDNIRELIEVKNGRYEVRNTAIHFSEEEILAELHDHPERFSPNVILRGLYQETVLPNIAFIGGGGETAYWLELKGLFDHYNVPFPMLVLRNSFLIVEKKWQEKIHKLGLQSKDFFQSEQQLLTQLVSRHKNGELKLKQELEAAMNVYEQLKNKAAAIDQSLTQHVEALQARTLKPLQELEKKLLRAEKKKYEAEQRQIQAIRTAIFPRNGLQERVDNFMPWYALWGREFIQKVYEHSPTLEQEFIILEEK